MVPRILASSKIFKDKSPFEALVPAAFPKLEAHDEQDIAILGNALDFGVKKREHFSYYGLPRLIRLIFD